MRARSWSAVGMVVLVVLSGCAGADPKALSTPTTTAPPPAPTIETGTISGVVVSEDQAPVPGVDVVIDGANATRTDEAGAFVFNGLQPGTYTILVSKLGFESLAKKVDVVAGEIAESRIEMAALVIGADPYYEMTPFEGIVQCSVNPYYSVQPCGTVVAEDTDQFVFQTDAARPFEEMVIELAWTPSTPGTAETMELDFCNAQPDRQADVLCLQVEDGYYEYDTSASPVVLRLGDVPIEDYNEWIVGAGSGFMEPTFSFQQRFTIYVTLCFVEDCAEDYTAIPPA